MSQRLVTPYVNTNIPGTYVNYQVLTQPTGVSSSGIAVIMGEANGGPSYDQIEIQKNFFTPDQLQQVTQIYTSGQIVDAFTALTSPSNDPNISGTATQIYIQKTNTGSIATATLLNAAAATYGTLSDINQGVLGNQDKYQVLAVDFESAPTVQGGTVPSFGGTTGAMFTVRVNGGAAVVVGPLPSSANIGALITNLNAAFVTAGVDLDATAGTAMNSLAINWSGTPGSVSPVADPDAWDNGWGKSFELIDSTSGDLASLGLVVGLSVSSQEPSVEVQDSNMTRGVSETLSASADIALTVGYQGTTATLTINQAAGTLTTTVTGGSGGNLLIELSQYSTIGTLAGFIASQPGYSCSVVPAANQLPTSALDDVSAIGIASTGAGDEPGRVKDSLYSFEQAMSVSRIMTFAATATAGLPAPMSLPAYLSGGARGATLAADVVNAVDDLASITCNIIVPLFSQDATADIAAGQTDPGSTYTIAAIDALLKSHCLEMSDPSLDKNRICILSNNGTFAAAQMVAQTLASFRCSLVFQNVTQVNSAGVITQFQPWYAATVACGMQLGGFYKSICNKYANLISVIDPSDYNSGDPGDTSEALSAGLLPLWTDVGGPKWVSDQTTYLTDTNFVYNSIQAVYDADVITIDLKSSFTQAFVGQSLADVSAASASAFLTQKMASYMQLKLIAPSNGAPLGFNNAKISIVAPTMTISVNIYLATAIYFIPITFSISAVQQSA
jgi:hypothetical protein